MCAALYVFCDGLVIEQPAARDASPAEAGCQAACLALRAAEAAGGLCERNGW
jgi:hypothetical protein